MRAPTHPYQRYQTASYNSADAGLAAIRVLLLLAVSQSGTFLAPPYSSVYLAMAAAPGIADVLPTTATLAVALAALV